MAGKGKRPPVPPRVTRQKHRPVPAAKVPAKPRPRCLQGIDGEPENGHPLWRMAFLDLTWTGEWSWQVEPSTVRKILAFLQDMERLTWTEIRAQLTGGYRRRGPKHKFIPADHLCEAAKRRLIELELDEFDQLFRFRLGNMERLWGVVDGEVFYPVWWDPDHKVCPVKDPDLRHRMAPLPLRWLVLASPAGPRRSPPAASGGQIGRYCTRDPAIVIRVSSQPGAEPARGRRVPGARLRPYAQAADVP